MLLYFVNKRISRSIYAQISVTLDVIKIIIKIHRSVSNFSLAHCDRRLLIFIFIFRLHTLISDTFEFRDEDYKKVKEVKLREMFQDPFPLLADNVSVFFTYV